MDEGDGHQERNKNLDASAEIADDTASSSSRGEDGEEDSSMNDEDEASDTEHDTQMPLLSYTRLFGSLPRRTGLTETSDDTENASPVNRTLAVPSTCAVMGQVILSQQDPTAPTSAAGAANSPEYANSDARTPDAVRRQSSQSQYYDPLLSQQPHYVMAMGYANGSADLVDPRTGVAVVPPQQLKLRESTHHREEAVVAMSIDSTGSYLAAVDTGRMVVIWEFRYTIALHSSEANNAPRQTTPSPRQPQQAPSTPADSGVFSSFMSALTLGGSTPTIAPGASLPSPTPDATTGSASVAKLATSSIQLSRITYPKSFGVPTCIAIDPTYSRKRDKAVLVGFLDGRLVLTKRGLIFQRRTDAIIYQGTYHENSKSPRGIEAIEWRGSLAAWADASGIRLFDTDSLTRIAHIDRPTGARPSLYPTLSSLRPNLKFEKQDYLLVAWGDCLMGLSITDHGRPSVTQESPAAQQPQQQPVARRRTVECAMAWELDCVASGVVPLDNNHVLVLGVVPPCDDDDDELEGLSSNDLEVQIVAKLDGSPVFSNILPLWRETQTTHSVHHNVAETVITESAADYTLLSSFALPRMEDGFEAEMMEEPVMEDFELQVSLFSPTSQPPRRFVDPHLKWSLNRTSFDDLVSNKALESGEGNQNGDDDNSVDSDDYGFIFRPLSTANGEEAPSERRLATATPPLMVIASTSDVVKSTMRDIDDAVAHALGAGKAATALQRGLRQKRRLRNFNINDLVSAYMASLLRVSRQEFGTDDNEEHGGPLSIRRLKLAAKAMPVLFGGEISLWKRWVAEVAKVPGAVFIVSDHLPVRDPKLPKDLYVCVLKTMLKEIHETKAHQESKDDFTAKGEQMFLNVLTGWGPTNFLKEHIKHCKYGGRSKDVDAAINDAECRFARRFTQTSAAYLHFPVLQEERDASNDTAPLIRSEGYFNSQGSLFDVDELIQIVSPHAPLASGMDSMDNNARVALDALAKLNMMKGQYDAALKYFITLGALPGARPLSDFKAGAVDFSPSVGSRQVDKPWQSANGAPYTFLLDIIDSHHLQQCLLNEHFLSDSNLKKVVPVFSLLQLVGFNAMGNFLIEHCVPPQVADRTGSQSQGGERRGTLPLDLVAAQLECSPRILQWYLHLVFTRKPESYVRFPNTAHPPQAITELHRIHFDLYLDFAGKERNSADALAGIEAYKVSSAETRLLLFLKTTLPLGGIRIQDARAALAKERAKDEEGFSTSFALEMAYIIEHYGEDTESKAQEVLDLYMKGAKSLVLAVAFAQRSRFSSRLWNSLIRHCLEQEGGKETQREQLDGSLFGALLEAAALSGADLAKLVSQIPPGMAIEGLRPRLVAAVADYRLKLRMHEAASDAATQEMISILREFSHRSRRGARYKISTTAIAKKTQHAAKGSGEISRNQEAMPSQSSSLPKSLRTSERRDRHRLGVAPAIR